MCGHIRLDRIRNETTLNKVEVTLIEDKIREIGLRWFGYLWRRDVEALVRVYEMINLSEWTRSKGHSKKS